MKRFLIALMFGVALCGVLRTTDAQTAPQISHNETGGPLMPEQAAYDVRFYDLALNVDPKERSIKGTLTVTARIVHPQDWFVLDLDPRLVVAVVKSVEKNNSEHVLRFERRAGQIWIAFAKTEKPGNTVRVRVDYGGHPRVAPMAPWDGGFVWAKTADGQPWIGVACQNEGADLWWPCKDHPSDEPDDGVALHITVPQPLICAANGRLESVVKNNDGTQTFNWRVTGAINNYDVTINVAPFRTIEESYQSVAGTTIPVIYWVLPQDYEKGKAAFPQFIDGLKFLEKSFGPYPFRADKVGLVETPYLGMEHQTITGFGGPFINNSDGFIEVMFHELAHEWWGNLVTASDWRDFWLHEGFAEYSEALYAESLKGEAAYHAYFRQPRAYINNIKAIAPREPTVARHIYNLPPDYTRSDGDIYYKGMLILHTLRYLIGDTAMMTTLHRMAYPTPELEKITDGRQTRLVTTDDFVHIAEEASGMKLDWFFEVYVRQPKLPRLVSETTPEGLKLHWDVPNGLPFPMPVEVKIAGETKRIEMKDGSAFVPLKAGEKAELDPTQWILKVEDRQNKLRAE